MKFTFEKLIPALFIILLFPRLSCSFSERAFPPVNGKSLVTQGTRSFTFAVVGDMRMPFRGKHYARETIQMLDEMAMLSPSFVLSLGNSYYGYGDTFQQFRDEIEYFLKTIEPLDVPFFNVIGDHDIAGSQKREKYVEELFGNLYGSFDYGGSHFIILDTEQNGGEGGIYEPQLKWLESDLAANISAANIFVFMHRPIYPMLTGKDEWVTGNDPGAIKSDALSALFRKYGVKAVFAGHEHLFNLTVKDRIQYFITAGGGAPLYSIKSRGGFLHFLFVTVNGTDYSFEVIRPDSIKIRQVSGNESAAGKVFEIENTSSAALDLKRVEVKMPWKEGTRYAVSAVSLTAAPEAPRPEIVSVKKEGKRTADISLRIEVAPQTRARVSIVAEAAG